jgi:hypothetical protein
MSIDINILARELQPSRTSILFGAGSSLPSGGPLTSDLCADICKACNIAYDNTLSLADVGTLAEIGNKRREMINVIRSKSKGLVPTAGLLNVPLYQWKSLFTTNYDELIEMAYAKSKIPLSSYSSNFDFGNDSSNATPLYKIHGTIQNDRTSGHQSSMVISNGDYDLSSQYRELIFDLFLTETSKNDFLVIGHSLSDPDLNISINEALRVKKKSVIAHALVGRLKRIAGEVGLAG